MIAEYLQLATLAYGNSITPFLDKGADKVYFYDAKQKGRADVQFYTVEYTHKIVFAIRGSESVSDFLDDSFCWTEKFQDVHDSNARVHSGFLKQYNAMRFAVMSSIYKMIWKKQNKKIVFTGHSLGGALATLCGAAVKQEMPDVHVSVYTYGSPRVGNKAFVEIFKAVDVSVRCVNGSDIVTSVPFWSYEHVHGEVQKGEKTYLNINDHRLDSYKTCCK